LIVSRDNLIAAYQQARETMDHDAAVAHVASTYGQAPETVQHVIDEEITA
jgi:hypothetical protein